MQSSCSVVVITLASHARGLRFEPGQEHAFIVRLILVDAGIYGPPEICILSIEIIFNRLWSAWISFLIAGPLRPASSKVSLVRVRS